MKENTTNNKDSSQVIEQKVYFCQESSKSQTDKIVQDRKRKPDCMASFFVQSNCTNSTILS